jgi:hypothetical protein
MQSQRRGINLDEWVKNRQVARTRPRHETLEGRDRAALQLCLAVYLIIHDVPCEQFTFHET